MWPKKPIKWIENKVLYVSIPFTWDLPKILLEFQQHSYLWESVVAGGPAVELMPGFFDGLDYVSEGHKAPGILQKINPLATRTTVGCVRHCKFCAIGTGKIEGKFRELESWPDLPIICDNNLLAASQTHFEKVIGKLINHKEIDFNQGLDCRLLTDYHAKKIAKIKRPICRLALDHMDYHSQWQNAFDCLREAGIAKRNISSYCLIGFQSDPHECWQRCEWIQAHGVKAYPMWFHALDQLEKNVTTLAQQKLGWSEETRKEIMGYYYQHRGVKLC